MFAVRLLYWCVLTRSESSSRVEEVVLQMSPDQEEETLHTGRTEADLQVLLEITLSRAILRTTTVASLTSGLT